MISGDFREILTVLAREVLFRVNEGHSGVFGRARKAFGRRPEDTGSATEDIGRPGGRF